MATKKPDNHTRKYIKSKQELGEMSHDEIDHNLQTELAQEDYSVKSDGEMSDEEYIRRFRVSLVNNILPDLPKIPGYHLCWVPQNSNNQYDTVDFRKRVGYSVVKPEEVPNFMVGNNRSGQHEGCVSYNELILVKIPDRLYQLYMRDSHHTQPIEQERVIKQNIVAIEDKEGQSAARDLNEMTGINNLARKVATPNFS